MNILKWIINLVSGDELHIGSRVMTPQGMGTVKNGVICVSLDKYADDQHRGVRNYCCTIDKVHVK